MSNVIEESPQPEEGKPQAPQVGDEELGTEFLRSIVNGNMPDGAKWCLAYVTPEVDEDDNEIVIWRWLSNLESRFAVIGFAKKWQGVIDESGY